MDRLENAFNSLCDLNFHVREQILDDLIASEASFGYDLASLLRFDAAELPALPDYLRIAAPQGDKKRKRDN